MLAYILIFTLIFLASFLDLISIERKNILFLGLCISLTLFVGTRLVGPDLFTYESFYNIIPPVQYLIKEFGKFTTISVFEPAFLLLNGVFKSFGASFNIFNFIFSVAFMYLFVRNIKHYTLLPFCALMVFTGFVYMTAFSAIRQIMAAAIFFYGLKYLLENKRKKFLLALLLALLFHYSSIVLFLIYFIANKRVKTKSIVLLFLVMVTIVSTGLLYTVASKLLLLIPIFPGKIQLYLSQHMPFWGSVSVFWVITLVLCLLAREKLERIDSRFNLFFNILWIGLAVYIFATTFGGFGRVLLFFKLGFVVVLPLFVVLLKEFYSKVLATLCIGLVCGLLFFSAILVDTRYFYFNRYLPYKTWLLQ
jgi:transmembrane protein EpsG